MNRYIAQDYHDVYVDLVYIEDQFLSWGEFLLVYRERYNIALTY